MWFGFVQPFCNLYLQDTGQWRKLFELGTLQLVNVGLGHFDECLDFGFTAVGSTRIAMSVREASH